MLAAQVAGSGLADITKYTVLKTMHNSKKKQKQRNRIHEQKTGLKYLTGLNKTIKLVLIQ